MSGLAPIPLCRKLLVGCDTAIGGGRTRRVSASESAAFAGVLRKSAHEVLDELGIENEPLLELARELERIALEDDYFTEKKLFPNVDFYSGIILRAMGFPTSMFTVLFALARTAGWIAQWKEMVEDPVQKIGRPRQLYTGPDLRDYVPLNKR